MTIGKYFNDHQNLVISLCCMIVSIILLNYDENSLLSGDVDNVIEGKTAQSSIYANHAYIMLSYILTIIVLICISLIFLYLSYSPKFKGISGLVKKIAEILTIIIPLYMVGITIYIITIIIKDFFNNLDKEPESATNHKIISCVVAVLLLVSTYEMVLFAYKK